MSTINSFLIQQNISRERILLEEQERMQEIIAKKNREMMLEDQTLYIFDSKTAIKSDYDRSKNRKNPDTEIDLKKFLLSERNDIKKRITQKDASLEGIKAVDSVRYVLYWVGNLIFLFFCFPKYIEKKRKTTLNHLQWLM